jgi:hypothetical protein
MRAKEFLSEAVKPQVANKLQFIKQKVDSGELKDPKTVDYIYKILQKPEIQQAITSYLGTVQSKDSDVAAFQARNNQMLADVVRKMPVEKEKLDQFVKRWATGKGFVKVDLLSSGNKGTLQQLIPDPTAFTAFEIFEKLRSTISLHKKGTAGYGEFGLAMLSPFVNLKAPGDIQVNGQPIEVKGNDARLYADERSTSIGEGLDEAPKGLPATAANVIPNQTPQGKTPPVPPQVGKKVAPTPAPEVKAKRGSEPGIITNVLAGILANDQETINQTIKAFALRGRKDGKAIVKNVQSQGEAGLDILKTEWWKAGFNAYHQAIQMPVMVIGFGQFLISDNPDDFIAWGCLPRSATNFGYMFGRTAGQTRETYPKIFVPGHNK